MGTLALKTQPGEQLLAAVARAMTMQCGTGGWSGWCPGMGVPGTGYTVVGVPGHGVQWFTVGKQWEMPAREARQSARQARQARTAGWPVWHGWSGCLQGVYDEIGIDVSKLSKLSKLVKKVTKTVILDKKTVKPLF